MNSLRGATSSRDRRFLAALLNFGLGIFNTFQISSIYGTQQALIQEINNTRNALHHQQAILADMSRGIARQMAQYSETQEVLFKSDVLLSAVSHLSMSYQPLFLGLQTILDHKFPATLVPTADN